MSCYFHLLVLAVQTVLCCIFVFIFRPGSNGVVNGPRERSGHRIIYHEGSIYAFGGYNPSLEDDPMMQTDEDWISSKPLFKELWKYNSFTSKWTKIQMHGQVPSQLASHTASLVDIPGQTPKMMVYGGTGTPYGVITSHFVFMLGEIFFSGIDLQPTKTHVMTHHQLIISAKLR